MNPHPKIKPIPTQRFASKKNQGGRDLQKRSTTSAKEFKFTETSGLPKHFTKSLISQHKPSKLEYTLKPQLLPKYFPSRISYFFSKIKDLQSITSFALKVHRPMLYDPQVCLRPLMMSLIFLKDFSDFSFISFTYLKDLKFFNMIFKYLKRIPTLKTLTISLNNTNNLSTFDLDILASGLSKLRQLRSLNLSFSRSFKLSDYITNKLTIVLPKLHSLAKIDIRFNESSPFVAYLPINLFSCLSQMEALSDITLGLQNKTSNANKELISEGLALLDPSQIRKISLQLYQSFDNNCLIQLSKTLKSFTSLDILHLDLSSYHHFQEEGTDALVSTLTSLVSLSSLTINICLKSDDEKFVESLAVPFRHLTNLVSLNLKFDVDEPSAQSPEIQHLFSSLKLLQSLRFLTLSSSFPRINDKNLEDLGESLKELPQLQSLSLDFAFVKEFTNDGIQALSYGIKTLTNLSSLALCIQGNDNMNDETIDYTIDILQNLSQLYSVDFAFIVCSQIDCFEGLLQALIQAKNIGEIALTLPNMTMMSPQISHLEKIKVIKNLSGY